MRYLLVIFTPKNDFAAMELISRQTASATLTVPFFQCHAGSVSIGKRTKKNTIRGEDQPKQSFEELLALVEEGWIDDLCQLTALFHDTCQHLLLQPFNLNPTFAGSSDVGGADADLIVDGCLIEIKTSKQMQIDADWLRQLVGYVLLDYNDEYHINSVALYMVRQGVLFTWPLADFLSLLTASDAITLPLLRQEFSDLCKNRRTGMRRQ